MKRAIVTGGAGFVGANLVRSLRQRYKGVQVLVIDDMRTGTFANLTDTAFGAEPFDGQLIARSVHEIDWPALLDDLKPDAVFHEASITDTTVMDEAKMIRDNVEPFAEMLRECVRRSVPLAWASSAATYGTDANGAMTERRPFRLEDAGRPANVYGFSKWLMEKLHHQTLLQHPKANVVGLRYFNVFGPGEQSKGKMASMIWQLTNQMLDGKRPRVFYDGQQARDQVYVQDVVDATIAGVQPGARSGIYNVGSGQVTSFNQMVEAINLALGTQHQPDYFPNPYTFYQDYTCADLTETERGLHWRPAHDPQQAITRYAQWIAQGRGGKPQASAASS